MRKHPFNMIEIALALGVAAIAIVSIMALFPVGFTTGRDAMAETYAAEAADEMLHQLESWIREDWDDGLGIIPEDQPDPEPGEGYIFTEVTQTLAAGEDDGVFRLKRFVDVGKTGEFDPDEDILDFEAIVVVSRGPVEIPGPGGVLEELDEDIAIRLEMEISWPARLPHERREKREYFYEFFKRN